MKEELKKWVSPNLMHYDMWKSANKYIQELERNFEQLAIDRGMCEKELKKALRMEKRSSRDLDEIKRIFDFEGSTDEFKKHLSELRKNSQKGND